MTVIAMTREMGTLGKDVAYALAGSLDLEIVHHELVEHDLSERLGVEDSAVHHYLEGSASLLERWRIDKRKLSRYTAIEILELAQKGNVLIRGWGATALLETVPHVLRVRICAPMAFREGVMMRRLGIDDRAAVRREIERSDAAHARTITSFFGIDWENPIHYHVVLNTEYVPVETAVRTIRLLADDPATQDSAASRAALADKLTEWRVRGALAERQSSGRLASLEVSVQDGNVVLYGTTGFTPFPKIAEQIARDVPGVKGVETRIIVMRNYGGM